MASNSNYGAKGHPTAPGNKPQGNMPKEQMRGYSPKTPSNGSNGMKGDKC